MKRTRLVLVLLAAAVIAVFLAWPLYEEPKTWQVATVFGDQARPLPAFTLVRHDSADLTAADFEGRWSLMFFGYSHCPDICAPTLQQLTAALQTLADDRARIVFVSIDPERDSPQVLGEYVQHFHPGTLGVTGKSEAVAEFSKAVGVFATERKLPTGYLMDHSSSVWLVDPEVRLAGVFTPPWTPEQIAADLRQLIPPAP